MTTVGSFVKRGTRGFVAPKFQLPLPNCLVGVEVEVDQDNSTSTIFPRNFTPEWEEKYDGSLANGKEYVLVSPLSGDAVVQAIYKLYNAPTSVSRTYTGSTHIHLDMLDGVTVEQLRTLSLLCYSMENMLYAVGDPTRKWCGYANQLISSPSEVLEALLGGGEHGELQRAIGKAGRYYGLNLAALDKYGSLEFRYFPTATNPEELIRWIVLCQLFKKAAMDIGTVEALIQKLSIKEGYDDLINSYFSDYLKEVESVGGFKKVKALMNKALIVSKTKKQKLQYDVASLVQRFNLTCPEQTARNNDIVIVVGVRGGGVPRVSDYVERESSTIGVLVHTNGDVYVSSPHYYCRYGSREWVAKYDITNVEELDLLLDNMDSIENAVTSAGHAISPGSYFWAFKRHVLSSLDEDLEEEESYESTEDAEEEY